MNKKIINTFRNAKFCFIMSVITFLIAFYFFYASKGDDWSYRYIAVVLGSIPFFIYFFLTYITNKWSYKKYTKAITSTIGILILLVLWIYYFMLIFMYTFVETEHPVKNIKNYHDFVNGSYLLKAFPKKIPEGVEEVRLIYSPSVLQAGTEVGLYYIDPKLDIQEFNNKYQEKSKWIGYTHEYSEKRGFLSGIFSNMPVAYEREKNFKVYLLDDSCDESGYCNHRHFLLVAVNEDTKEVMYKAESW